MNDQWDPPDPSDDGRTAHAVWAVAGPLLIGALAFAALTAMYSDHNSTTITGLLRLLMVAVPVSIALLSAREHSRVGVAFGVVLGLCGPCVCSYILMVPLVPIFWKLGSRGRA